MLLTSIARLRKATKALFDFATAQKLSRNFYKMRKVHFISLQYFPGGLHQRIQFFLAMPMNMVILILSIDVLCAFKDIFFSSYYCENILLLLRNV